MLRVLVVDDHDIVRLGVRRLLEDTGRYEAVLEAGSGEEAVQMVAHDHFHAVLMDLTMPGMGGLEAMRKILRQDESCRIIVLSAHSEGALPRKVMSLGAAGYLTKGCSVDEMVTAIRKAVNGGTYISSEVAQRLALEAISGDEGTPFERLSAREFDVVKHTVEGYKNNQIAALLHLSDKTVSTYRSRAMTKLDVSSTAELTRLAIQHGVVEDRPQI